MMKQPKALIFDLNGTMIDDMRYHNIAWYDILTNDLGGNFTRDEVKHQMYGKNQELLVRMFGPNRFTKEEMDQLSLKKEQRYQQEFLPHLKLLPGLQALLEKAYQQHIPMAIGSAAIMFNIDFVLDNLNIRHYFKVIVSADDVTESKPHPETYLNVASLLGIDPAECLVFEDVPKGAEAALRAGMQAVILTTTHMAHEFADFSNVLYCGPDYENDFIKMLI